MATTKKTTTAAKKAPAKKTAAKKAAPKKKVEVPQHIGLVRDDGWLASEAVTTTLYGRLDS